MTEEILINVTPRETRVGVVENGMLQEVHIERSSRRGYVGNIYKGRVKRVMPGMQAAFVDIGLERSAFLHAADMVRPALASDGIEGATPAAANVPPITELVHEGQQIVVQVIKDPIGSKGARLSTQLVHPIALSGASAGQHDAGRVGAHRGRGRTRTIARHASPDLPAKRFGLIVRTNAEGLDAVVLAEDVAYVTRVWQTVCRRRSRTAQLGDRVYEELPLPLRVLRDLMHDDIEKVRVDSHETFERTLAVCAQVHAGPDRPGRTLPRRAPDLRPVRRRGRNPEGAEARKCR